MKRLLTLTLLASLAASSAVVGTITKFASEQFTLSVDFTPVTGTNGITLQSVTAVDINSGQGASNIIAPSPVPAVVPSTDQVVFRVQGGQAGKTYAVDVLVADMVTGDLYDGRVTVLVAH